jgi:hypothetical protein
VRFKLFAFVIGILTVAALAIFVISSNVTTDIPNKFVYLPYLQYGKKMTIPNESGITYWNNEKSYNGYLVYDDTLVDDDGRENPAPRNQIFPNNAHAFQNNLVEHYTNEFLAKISNHYFIHHEKLILNNKNLLFITFEPVNISGAIILFDKIIEVDRNGDIIFEWSSYGMKEHIDDISGLNDSITSLFLDQPIKNISYQYLNLSNLTNEQPLYDSYHMNSVFELGKNIHSSDDRFKAGNLLVSMRNIDMMIIIDKDSKEIVWHYGRNGILKQHSPYMIENGNILFFDNGDNSRKYSRGVELNPLTRELIWEYGNRPDERFYSEYMGNAQRLPNGNTLITDGSNGRIFEVTPGREMVFEYFTPHKTNNGFREVIYRAFKVDKAKYESLKAIG